MGSFSRNRFADMKGIQCQCGSMCGTFPHFCEPNECHNGHKPKGTYRDALKGLTKLKFPHDTLPEKKIEGKPCICCGRAFYSRHKHQIVCSLICKTKRNLAKTKEYNAANGSGKQLKPQLERVCIECGLDFSTAIPHKLTCSSGCSRKYKSRSRAIKMALRRREAKSKQIKGA